MVSRFRSALSAVGRVLGRLRRLGLTLLFALAIIGGAVGGVLLAYTTDLPQISSLEDYQPNIVTEIYAADGKLVGTFAIERRVIVSFQDIPPVLRNAIVATEDEDFWKHLGVNVWRVPSVIWANLRAGRKVGGASTLTMQLSRVLFLTPEKTYERKLKEILLAFQIEKNFTKEEIFTMYCNQVYFGHGNYGVEAAAQSFFDKSLKDLTLTEAALIAGLPQSPSRLSPFEHPERVTARRNHVLNRMMDEKYISREEGEKAKKAPLGLHPHREPPSIAPYFVEEVRKYLEKEYGSQRIYQGGLRVHTTLQPAWQVAANRALGKGVRAIDRRQRGFVVPEVVVKAGDKPESLHLPEWDGSIAVGDVVRGVVLASTKDSATVRIGPWTARIGAKELEWTKKRDASEALPVGAVTPFGIVSLDEATHTATVTVDQEPKVQGGFVALDVRTGAVRAMVGGYDFEKSKFNRATQAYRQVGSAFKPILYAAAIEKLGWNPSTLIDDSPISFPSGSGGVWAPHNYDFKFEGPVTMRWALEESRNIPAVKTLAAMGVETGISYARKLGLLGEIPPYLPIAIGASEATLMEITSAFATFPNQGLRMKPFLITRITDRDGNVVEEHRPEAQEAVRADTAYIMTSMMRGVVLRGTGVAARKLNRPIGGKTGTTNDFTDAWFIGYEPKLSAGVWVGHDDKRIPLGHKEEGARAALPIWMDFWTEATKDLPVEEYPVPANIVFRPTANGGHPNPRGEHIEPFVAGTEPKAATASATETE